MRSIPESDRATLIARIGKALYVRHWLRRREQPRDGRGRFLSKAWLQRAETYSAADLAWFRRPATEAR